MNTSPNLGLSRINTPAVDSVDNYRLAINQHADVLDGNVGIIAQRSVLDTGLLGQTRAGRQLSNSDFTDCGAAVPVGLWNLTDLTDASGNGLTLGNRGAVTFGLGIEGAAPSAALNVGGSSTSCLYRADSGAGVDLTMRIRTGSWGGWHKTAKQGVDMPILHKGTSVGNQNGYGIRQASAGKYAVALLSLDGTNWQTLMNGDVRIDDDRWHHVVATHDGLTFKLYLDGTLVNQMAVTGPIHQSTGPLNIGSSGGSSGTPPLETHYGRVDEAFVTAEVLSPDQIRHLYGCKFAHGAAAPRRVELRVTRRRLGAALVNGDFPSNPLRCWNFTAGAYTDLNGATPALAPSGGVTNVAGPDGVKDSAIYMQSGNYLSCSDTGFPTGTGDRTYGLWFSAHPTGVNQQLMSWGTAGGAFATLLFDGSGNIVTQSAGDSVGSSEGYLDGTWHHAVVAETNTPADGAKRKLYVDGALIATSTVLNAVTPLTGLRIGLNLSGGSGFSGAVSRAFVFNGLLTWEQIQTLYLKGSAALQASPKDAADHIEMLGATNLVFVGDTLEPQWQVDLEVSR